MNCQICGNKEHESWCPKLDKSLPEEKKEESEGHIEYYKNEPAFYGKA
jgi:hypothetical protein